jgi:diguanylate cyclase (GGDEF)-like protein
VFKRSEKMIKTLQRYKREREAYFIDGEEEIKQTNLKTLFQITGGTVVFICLLMAITPFIIEGWMPTLTHILLVPVTVVFFFISFMCLRSKNISKYVVDGVCLTFIACIFIFVIQLDIFQYTNAPGSFMEAVLLIVPTLFIFRFHIIYLESIFFEIVYVTCTFLVKSNKVANSDVFNSIVGLLLSVIVAYIIQRLRAEAYHAQNKYRKLSMTDGLTGIMNKVNCEHFVKQYLKERIPLDNCALLIVDIDNFKNINDSMGHKMGDHILSAIGNTLNRYFRSTDILGRIGGDEFMILMRGIPSQEIVEDKCERILGLIVELSEEFQVDLSCSIGVGLLEGEDVEYEEIFQVADDALYEAKASGKARYVIHHVNENI